VWMHTQNNITNTNLQYSSNLCHCYNCFLDHLCPMMVHFSQSAMLHCRVIPTKHTEFIGCISHSYIQFALVNLLVTHTVQIFINSIWTSRLNCLRRWQWQNIEIPQNNIPKDKRLFCSISP
jgi:hypothetical protein